MATTWPASADGVLDNEFLYQSHLETLSTESTKPRTPQRNDRALGFHLLRIARWLHQSSGPALTSSVLHFVELMADCDLLSVATNRDSRDIHGQYPTTQGLTVCPN